MRSMFSSSWGNFKSRLNTVLSDELEPTSPVSTSTTSYTERPPAPAIAAPTTTANATSIVGRVSFHDPLNREEETEYNIALQLISKDPASWAELKEWLNSSHDESSDASTVTTASNPTHIRKVLNEFLPTHPEICQQMKEQKRSSLQMKKRQQRTSFMDIFDGKAMNASFNASLLMLETEALRNEFDEHEDEEEKDTIQSPTFSPKKSHLRPRAPSLNSYISRNASDEGTATEHETKSLNNRRSILLDASSAFASSTRDLLQGLAQEEGDDDDSIRSPSLRSRKTVDSTMMSRQQQRQQLSAPLDANSSSPSTTATSSVRARPSMLLTASFAFASSTRDLLQGLAQEEDDDDDSIRSPSIRLRKTVGLTITPKQRQKLSAPLGNVSPLSPRLSPHRRVIQSVADNVSSEVMFDNVPPLPSTTPFVLENVSTSSRTYATGNPGGVFGRIKQVTDFLSTEMETLTDEAMPDDTQRGQRAVENAGEDDASENGTDDYEDDEHDIMDAILLEEASKIARRRRAVIEEDESDDDDDDEYREGEQHIVPEIFDEIIEESQEGHTENIDDNGDNDDQILAEDLEDKSVTNEEGVAVPEENCGDDDEQLIVEPLDDDFEEGLDDQEDVASDGDEMI